MLQNSPLIAFATTARPDQTRIFYEDVLGLTPTYEDDFALVFDACGTMLRLSKVPDCQPTDSTVVGWQVEAITDTVVALTARGVAFTRYPSMKGQDEFGIWTHERVAKVAWFKDPDGNTLSLTQFLQ
ncbi:MAG: VOC family protein [Chloroflexota bacterium]